MKGIYEFAGHLVEIHSLHDRVHQYCEEYLAEGKPEFIVEIRPEDILFERAKADKKAREEGRIKSDASDDYLEELAVYRKISERMPAYSIFLFHASCIAVNGRGILFTAKSGTGKSTHARLWRERFGERVVMVNDDKPMIYMGQGEARVYGTPYTGKHKLGSRISVPIQAICLLVRSEENWIKPITKTEAFPMLLQQVYRPADPLAMNQTVGLLDQMASKVNLYRMGVNMTPDAAEMAWKNLIGNDETMFD